jgi:hypothetical protein
MEVTMEKKKVAAFPRWMFVLLAIGGAWASGIYVGKASVTGFSVGSLIPEIAFGVMSLIMAWGALATD